METTLHWQECAEALVEKKSAGMDAATWKLVNRKVVAHNCMAVSNEVLENMKGLASGHEVWSKQRLCTSQWLQRIRFTWWGGSFMAALLEDASLQLNTFQHLMVKSISFKM